MVMKRGTAFMVHETPEVLIKLSSELERRGYDIRHVDSPGSPHIPKKIPEGSLLFVAEELSGEKAAVKLRMSCHQKGIPFFIIGKKSGEIYAPMDESSLFRQLDEQLEFRKVRFEYSRLAEENEAMQSFYRNLLDGISEAILMVNLDFEIQYCNRSAEKLIGGSRKTLLNQNLHRFIKDGYKVLNHIYQQLMRRQKIGGYLITVVPENGAGSEVNLNADLIRNADGNIEGLILAMENTSFQSELFNRRLRKEKLTTIEQLAGALAHEIRNPINILSGRVQLLKNDLASQGFDKSFHTIERQMDRISTLASQLLKFNYSQEDSIPQIFSLCQFVSNFCENHRREFENIDVKFDARREKHENILIEADQYRLEDAFGYLLETLNRNLPPKTEMHIACGKAKSFSAKAVVEIQFLLHGRHDLEPIFEPFRLQTHTENHPSFGVAIMYTIFANCEASLSVDAPKGNRTSIRLQFPIHDLQPEKPTRKNVHHRKKKSRRTAQH